MAPYREIDLSKGIGHEHPDVSTQKTYLAKIGGSWFLGRFTRQHYGLSFADWGASGLQLDAPGTNASQWERLVEFDPEALPVSRIEGDGMEAAAPAVEIASFGAGVPPESGK